MIGEYAVKSESGLLLIRKMIQLAFPEVHFALKRWRGQASLIPDSALRVQALSSIEKKAFHCQGGAAYALYPTALTSNAIQFIVAYQTISDYLDNLCDRSGVTEEEAFRQLHLAMADAVDPNAPMHDYYKHYPHKDDGGYLDNLVAACRREVERLPSLGTVKHILQWLSSLYSELQNKKHVLPTAREEKLLQWASLHTARYPMISVWEFCAATGSTLGIFLLFAAAQSPDLTTAEAEAMLAAYFPWVCGLHILLDYFIDAEEDAQEGDFNFISYYKNAEESVDRLSFFMDQALLRCSTLKYPGFHKTVIRGLLAMYLSDRKVDRSKRMVKRIVQYGGGKAVLYWEICKAMRMLGKL